jgi:hypothetical protein
MTAATKTRMSVNECLAWAQAHPGRYYLVVDPDKPLVVHHARASGETIHTRVVTQGTVELDPPGLAVALADFYAS